MLVILLVHNTSIVFTISFILCFLALTKDYTKPEINCIRNQTVDHHVYIGSGLHSSLLIFESPVKDTCLPRRSNHLCYVAEEHKVWHILIPLTRFSHSPCNNVGTHRDTHLTRNHPRKQQEPIKFLSRPPATVKRFCHALFGCMKIESVNGSSCPEPTWQRYVWEIEEPMPSVQAKFEKLLFVRLPFQNLSNQVTSIDRLSLVLAPEVLSGTTLSDSFSPISIYQHKSGAESRKC